jgi:hypothetical protein
MRRKYRPFVLIAVALYLFVLWAAFRWGGSQRFPEGNLFDHMEAERKKKEALNAPKPEPPPPSNPAARFNRAEPSFIAVRYDASRVVFIVADDTESRFKSGVGRSSAPLQKIPPASKPAAPLAGLQELWEADAAALFHLPESLKNTSAGEQWSLYVSPISILPVVIERPVVAPTGCGLGVGFLAVVAPEQQAAFAASAQDYFVVRRTPVESADPPASQQITESTAWKGNPEFDKDTVQLLNERMKQEVSRIDAQLTANAATHAADENTWPERHRLKEWLHLDKRLVRGEGKFEYDVRALRLAPDGVPRLFVRDRWTLFGAPVFLMTAWFKAEAKPVLLSADSSWSVALREREDAGSLGDTLDFQSVLNEFDADHDGWAELLVHTSDGSSSLFTLYLYTDLGLVPLKTSFPTNTASLDSCLDP